MNATDLPKIAAQSRSLLDRFKSAVKEHLAATEVPDGARSVQYYAGLLLVHPNYLNAVVKKNTGRPAISHIHQQVIDEAKWLLGQTGLPVKDIAYRLAFREPAHFHTFFRKNTLQTPNEYRRYCRASIYMMENT